MQSDPVPFERHEFQLVELMLISCSVEQVATEDAQNDERLDRTFRDVKIYKGTAGTVEEGSPVDVAIKVAIGTEIDDPAFRINAHLVGRFETNVQPFDVARVEQWAKSNAYLLLLPFVREVLFSATKYMPSGPYIVPLITLPG